MGDTVNHPDHYTWSKFETIDVIEEWELGYHLGNAVKYISRAEHKDDQLEDLKKAKWYLDRRVAQLERQIAAAKLKAIQQSSVEHDKILGE